MSALSSLLLVMAALILGLGRQYHRVACSMALLIPSVAHYALFDSADGWAYYGSAMAFNAMSVALLQFVKPNDKPSQIVVHLQLIALLLMGMNLLGYVIWYAYMPPYWYNAAIATLSIIEALRIFVCTNGDKLDGTNGRFYNRGDFTIGGLFRGGGKHL